MQKFLVGLMLWMFTNAVAYAAMSDIKAANNLLTVQAMVLNVDYGETDSTGKLLDTEQGRIQGRMFAFSGMAGNGNFYYQLQYNRNEGQTDYVGGTISPPSPYGSVLSVSGARVTDYGLRLGKGYDYAYPEPRGGYARMLTPYLELGRHEWFRGVNAGETYTHNYYALGLMWQLSDAASRLVYTLNVMAGRTVGAWIDVEPSTAYSPPIPALNVALGSAPVYRAGIALDYALTAGLHLKAGVDIERFSYGRSEVVGGYYEPDSTTTLLKYMAGLGFAF